MSFSELGLSSQIGTTLRNLGYSTPTPIQREIIPKLLEGRDVVGQAQTGTGKTAAFALPLLSRLEPENKKPQVLVLVPTRELAIQVAASFSQYSDADKRISVLPIFGGQEHAIQLKHLRRRAQVIVGTPGRIIDFLKRGSLQPSTIHSLVLDEADEMLRMGFIDDVTWILEQLTNRDQTALFSATMDKSIREIASKHLKNPAQVTIKSKAITAQTVRQRCVLTPGGFERKVDILSDVLETETHDGVLIFVRTKIQTVELAEKLAARGYKTTALNGDIQQSQRQRAIELLKKGAIDILVATDVAARGLDVERISHVINFDIPFDTEAYVHRIGRTGRAGREGNAILFVNPRERSMLKSIERTTKQKIEMMALPTAQDINKNRVSRFKTEISANLEANTSFYEELIFDYVKENGADIHKVAAALARMTQGKDHMLTPERKTTPPKRHRNKGKAERPQKETKRSRELQVPAEEGMERFRLEVGNSHGVKPGNIVGAIANEADINSRYIGRISIFDSYSTVDLPFGMPNDVLHLLQRARIGSRKMKISRMKDSGKPQQLSPKPHPAGKRKSKKKLHRKITTGEHQQAIQVS